MAKEHGLIRKFFAKQNGKKPRRKNKEKYGKPDRHRRFETNVYLLSLLCCSSALIQKVDLSDFATFIRLHNEFAD